MDVEKRLDRFEKRLDEIKDDVSELKAEFKVQNKLIKEHVAGDTKIIKEISPLLSALPDLLSAAQDHKVKKEIRQQQMEKLKYWSIRVTILSTVVGILFQSIKLFF